MPKLDPMNVALYKICMCITYVCMCIIYEPQISCMENMTKTFGWVCHVIKALYKHKGAKC